MNTQALDLDEAVRVPFVVAGRLVEGASVFHRSRDSGSSFITPELDFGIIAPSRTEPCPAANLKTEEIIDFLAAVGERMTLDNPYIAQSLEHAERLTAMPRRLLERIYGSMKYIFDRRHLEISVEADIGADALDGWRALRGIAGRRSFVRACPPRIVHILAGNSPTVLAHTVAVGALSKGTHLLKMPSNDPFTATAVLRTMAAIDPDHPIVRSFSAVYWRGGDVSTESLLYRAQFFDKIVVWGGEKAVLHVRQYVGPGLQLVAWDPKTSASMIGREAFASEEALSDAARRAAIDAAALNQDACVSSRYQYVEGSVEQVDRFCERLVRELGVERQFSTASGLPTPAEIRNQVDVLGAMEPEFRVWGDFSGRGLVIRSEEPVEFFPDCRTVNVVPVGSLRDAVRFANVATQTVGVYPAERKAELRDALSNMGVQRLCYLGEAMDVPAGTPHDGCYELQRLVRWMTDEGTAYTALSARLRV